DRPSLHVVDHDQLRPLVSDGLGRTGHDVAEGRTVVKECQGQFCDAQHAALNQLKMVLRGSALAKDVKTHPAVGFHEDEVVVVLEWCSAHSRAPFPRAFGGGSKMRPPGIARRSPLFQFCVDEKPACKIRSIAY